MSLFSEFIHSSTSFAVPGANAPNYGAVQRYPCFMPPTATSGKTMTANKLYGMRFYVRETYSFSAIEAYQNNSGTTGNMRLGIYADSNGLPGSLVQDAGAVSWPASTGWRSVTTTIALTGGTWYWAACVADAALQTIGPNVTGSNVEESMVIRGAYDTGLSTVINSSPNWSGNGFGCAPLRATLSYGALPTPFSTLEAYDSACPIIYLKG